MPEIIANLHMHTTYSDGHASHAEIAQAALKAGLDVVIVTDHNVLVSGLDSYHQKDGKTVLLLVGEEVHDQNRQPQKSHLLVLGAGRELATFAPETQRLVDQVQLSDGVSFIAHPYENALPAFGEGDISWENWEVRGYTGIELWNGLSELKNVIHSRLQAIFYALLPQYIARGPLPQVLARWDEITSSGRRVVAVAGSDAHAMHMHMGPIRRTIFPYEFHFRCINNHLIIPQALSGDLTTDRRTVLAALRKGNSFIGYDLPAPTQGFTFTAIGMNQTAQIGDEIELGGGITFKIRLPLPVECRLIKNGKLFQAWQGRDQLLQTINEPGVYRVECSIDFLGRPRGWIYTNPIYVRPNVKPGK